MPWTFGYVPVQSSVLKCQREAHVPVTHIPCTPHAKHWQQRRKHWGKCSLGYMSSLGWWFRGWRFGLPGRKVRTSSVRWTHTICPPPKPATVLLGTEKNPSSSHFSVHPALVLWVSIYTQKAHDLQWQQYRGWNSLEWFTAEDETVRKTGSGQNVNNPMALQGCMVCADAHTLLTEPQPRLTINHPAINPPCSSSSQLEWGMLQHIHVAVDEMRHFSLGMVWASLQVTQWLLHRTLSNCVWKEHFLFVCWSRLTDGIRFRASSLSFP